ncbi:TPA: DUF262 domain-containing protein [Enterococcus faecalis]|nr:DUF262 domain-containing protein [Enterococcus faecalis]
MKKKFEAKQCSVEELLKKNKQLYKVSNFQRTYAWKYKQQEDLMNDLFNHLKITDGGLYENSDFFMGSFIFYKGSREKNIVDGQQRLITLSIVFSIIRRKCIEIKNNSRIKFKKIETHEIAEDIINDLYGYIYTKIGSEIAPTVWPHSKNEQIYLFGEILNTDSNQKINTPECTSCNSYYEAYNNIEEIIDSKLEIKRNNFEKVKLLKALFDQIKFAETVVLNLDDENTAYEIYSNINSKGVTLTDIDLIKNDYIYKTKDYYSVPGQTNIASELWDKINLNITLNSTITFHDFFKYCWYMLHEEDVDEYYDSESNLFEMFQNKYRDGSSARKLDKLFHDLELLSKLLHNLETTDNLPKNDNWPITIKKITFLNKISNDSISNLYKLWVLPLYYKAISADKPNNMKYFSAFKKCIPFISDTLFTYKLLLRYQETQHEVLSDLESLYSSIFRNLLKFKANESPAIIVEELKRERSGILNNSQEIIQKAIQELSYSKKTNSPMDTDLVRYLIERLNENDFNTQSVVGGIEHIIEDEKGTKCSSNIGNLVFLEGNYNDMANKIKQDLLKKHNDDENKVERLLLEKKFTEIYTRSEYPQVKELCRTYPDGDFTEVEVKERAKYMAKYFIDEYLEIN